ncbi:unnamed protein product [Phaeothamnion confervicola]
MGVGRNGVGYRHHVLPGTNLLYSTRLTAAVVAAAAAATLHSYWCICSSASPASTIITTATAIACCQASLEDRSPEQKATRRIARHANFSFPFPLNYCLLVSLIMSSDDAKKLRVMENGNAHEILPGVFLGNAAAASDLEGLKSIGVTSVVTANGKAPAFPEDLKYAVVNVNANSSGVIKYLPESLDLIENAVGSGESVLIHCYHGTGRSAAVAVAATMKLENKTFEEAHALVQERRPGTDIPENMLAELAALKFEKETGN